MDNSGHIAQEIETDIDIELQTAYKGFGDCWSNESGGYLIFLYINYLGKNYVYFSDNTHGYGGNGDGIYHGNDVLIINSDRKFIKN
ncbi:hypothetical protein [Xenorhabdus littoralis]|uniref:hypothetical protein n=1 Tax=Xenorhabdus littoralis TaxID=2582835 RepID=UPI0029E8103F|nr:hypothetical protein [Xenorhabdus sp. psl]MDX7993085.1 hypothetical protein [Xenorhabdus sp. psl]